MSRPRTPRQTSSASPPRSGRSTRSWFRFGPGLLIVALALWLASGTLQSQLGGKRPLLDRSAVSSIPPPPAAPELSWVLAQHESLTLSPAQVGKLRRLETRWERDTHALREALTQATTSFNRSMNERGGRGLNVQDFQEQAGAVSDLSRQLAEARRACWSEASGTLTPTQKQQAEAAWNRRWSPNSVRNKSGE